MLDIQILIVYLNVIYNVKIGGIMKIDKRKIAGLKRRRKNLVEKLVNLHAVMPGSLYKRFTECGNANCRCKKGQRHGPHYYIAVMMEGRQRQFYVPDHLSDKVKQWQDNYKHIQDLLHQIASINRELMRIGILDDE